MFLRQFRWNDQLEIQGKNVTTPMLSTNSKTSESDILRLLDQLEALIDGSRHFFSHAVWVDLDQFFALTSTIRQHLPDDIRRATKVARDSEKIVEQARGEAERIRNEAGEDGERILQESRRNAERMIRDAQEQGSRLLSEHEIIRAAQQQARAVIQEAQDESLGVRRGADEYAGEVLAHLDEVLSKATTHVRRGLEKLSREITAEQ